MQVIIAILKADTQRCLPDHNVIHKHQHEYYKAKEIKHAISDERPPGQVQNLTECNKREKRIISITHKVKK